MSASQSLHPTMPYDEIGFDKLVKILADNFNILADEVQLLSDRKTILEHKLRFAHEQYQRLADKYVPSDPEISNTLAKLQLPPELNLHTHDRVTFVPLPSRKASGFKQQTAEAIRDGRRASRKIASLRGWMNPSDAGNISTSGSTENIVKTPAPSAFEQDFTVPGKKSELLCPFAKMACETGLPSFAGASQPTSGSLFDPEINPDQPITTVEAKPPIHPPSADPICAALYSESHLSPPPSVTGSAAKCPIRFLDQHSPEEVARYFETHKHEIPRSHEVCVKRYQRNEADTRKLDAKYGDLVSMITDLGHKHQSMLQLKEDLVDQGERKPNERVQSWAKAVTADEANETDEVAPPVGDDKDREGRFDRPLTEVRVGESPSRPWGISLPYIGQPNLQETVQKGEESPAKVAKPVTISRPPETVKECPFHHGQRFKDEQLPRIEAKPIEGNRSRAAFIQPPDLSRVISGGRPQMVFTGPVFIGYPIDQAMTLMQQWQGSGNTNGML